MKGFVALLFYLLYWLICYLCTGTDRKNLAGLRSYPEAVQQAVRSHADLGQAAPRPKSIALVLFGNILLFTTVFALLGLGLKNLLGLTHFATAFWFYLLLGEGLGVFDLLVIDLLWWRNTPRIRFSFLPDQAAYRDPSNHVASFLRGIPMFALVAVLSAAIVTQIG